jgi:hypothetical protein
VDCHDTPDGPRIFHQYTLTSKIKFEDVIVTIKENAFKTSELVITKIINPNFLDKVSGHINT